jgi:hypothetical protein
LIGVCAVALQLSLKDIHNRAASLDIEIGSTNLRAVRCKRSFSVAGAKAFGSNGENRNFAASAKKLKHSS